MSSILVCSMVSLVFMVMAEWEAFLGNLWCSEEEVPSSPSPPDSSSPPPPVRIRKGLKSYYANILLLLAVGSVVRNCEAGGKDLQRYFEL